jgi:hypothetical protein
MARRSDTNDWLIGQRSCELTGSMLPSKREVMSVFLHFHLTKKKTLRESASLLADSVLSFWFKARIPCRQKRNVIVDLESLFNEWKKL